ncbi:hypothetical protein [Paenibacillus phyllosphaerae]|uniref:hypothetical protein n=1 Tax=Paenibacillus phyllosphaerae TaxID=274593 RepID=UPI001FE7FB01|nr:hypothetical protein [Paenibacillus phyllosphaerae]
MFEFELQELFPYLLSVSLLYSFVYAYAHRLQPSERLDWDRDGLYQTLTLVWPNLDIRNVPIIDWLVRKVKRKEAPDDDITACSPSLLLTPDNNEEDFNEEERCIRRLYHQSPFAGHPSAIRIAAAQRLRHEPVHDRQQYARAV